MIVTLTKDDIAKMVSEALDMDVENKDLTAYDDDENPIKNFNVIIFEKDVMGCKSR